MPVSLVQTIRRLDSQSRLNMITLFCVGVPQYGGSILGSITKNCAKYFDEYLKLRKTHRLQTWRSVFFINLLDFIFLTLSTEWFSNYLPNGSQIIFLLRECKPRIATASINVGFSFITCLLDALNRAIQHAHKDCKND